MFKKLFLATILTTSLVTSSFAKDAVSPTVAVINVPYVLSSIPQSQSMQDALQKEFAPREEELKKLEKEGQTLANDIQSGKLQGTALVDAQRKLESLQSNFNLKAKALQEDMRKRGSEEQLKLIGEVQKAVDSIAQEKGIELVIRGEAVIYAVNALNISEEVIKRVSKK